MAAFFYVIYRQQQQLKTVNILYTNFAFRLNPWVLRKILVIQMKDLKFGILKVEILPNIVLL